MLDLLYTQDLDRQHIIDFCIEIKDADDGWLTGFMACVAFFTEAVLMRMPPILQSCFLEEASTCLSTIFFHSRNAAQNSALQAGGE